MDSLCACGICSGTGSGVGLVVGLVGVQQMGPQEWLLDLCRVVKIGADTRA